MSPDQYRPLSELAEGTPYSAEYLSLLARQGKLKAKKEGRNWTSTQAHVRAYIARQAALANASNERLVAYTAQKKEEPIATPTNVAVPTMPNIISAPVTPREYVSPARSADQAIPRLNEEAIADRIADRTADTLQKKGDVAFDQFIGRFVKYLDAQILSRTGRLNRFRVWVLRTSKDIANDRRMMFFTFLFVASFVLLPVKDVFSQIDNAAYYVWNAVRDADTLMGHRAGTHENEVLLLGDNGEISIRGHIETDGQLKSHIANGLAPIVVDSITRVNNLNVDYIDDLSSEDFTLAFVTKNGNVTYDDVFLEGKVHVGKNVEVDGTIYAGDTLIVAGATELMSELTVHGTLRALGSAVIGRDLTVRGLTSVRDLIADGVVKARAVAADVVFAGDVIASSTVKASRVDAGLVTATNLGVESQSTFNGVAFFNGGLWGKYGTFDMLLDVGGDFGATGKYVTLGKAHETKITANGTQFTYNGSAVCTAANNACPTANDAGWTDDGSVVRLTNASDIVGIGTTSPWGGALLAIEMGTSSPAFVIGDSGTSTPFFFVDGSGNVGLGTSSPYEALSVIGDTFISGTTTIGQDIVVSGTGSSTIGGTLEVGGIILAEGGQKVCTSANGACSGSGTINTGTAGKVAYYSAPGAVSSGDFVTIDTTNSRVGIGTSSPYAPLSVAGQIVGAYFTGTTTATSTLAGGLQAATLNLTSSTASSTFANGIVLTSGCFSVGGVCIDDDASTVDGLDSTAFLRKDTNDAFQSGNTLTIQSGAIFDVEGDLEIGDTSVTFNGASTNFAISNDFSINSTEFFLDDITNNVGISDGTPDARLEVAGGGFMVSSAAANDGDRFIVTSAGLVGVGTSTPGRLFAVQGDVLFGNVYATGTYAFAGTGTSTLAGSLDVGGDIEADQFFASGSGTSTFAGGIQTNLLNVTSTTASSTFANGINLANGCFAINGTCVGGSGSGTVGPGTPNKLSYFDSGTTVTSADFLTVDALNGRLGIGTTSPYVALGVSGEVVAANFTATTSATSTLPNLNVSSALALNGDYVTDLNGTGLQLTAGVLSTTLGTDIDLASAEVTGTLAVANGGTGSTTLTGLLKGNGTSMIQSAVAGTDYESPLTFNGPLSRSVNAVSITQSGVATDGYLSSTDWNTFNNKVSSSSIDTFTELDLLVADKTLVNADDAATISGLWAFTNTGTTTFAGGIRTPALSAIDYLVTGGTATTTIVGNNATSTFAGNIDASGDIEADQFFASGSGTSTFAGGIRTNLLNITSTTATSTFANGTNLTAGCYAINGSCVAGGSPNYVKTGTANRLAYFDTTGTVTSENVFAVDATNDRVGFGTTTPLATLSASSTNAVAAIFDQRGTSDILQLQDGGSTVFVVKDGGNVGIGTSSPFARLSLAPTGNSTIPFAVGSTTGVSLAVNNQGYVGIGTAEPSTNLHLLNDYEDPAVRFQVTASTLAVSNTGAVDGGTFGVDTSVGTRDWDNEVGAQTNNLDYAYNASALTGQTYYLTATNFDFSSIPTTATIVGVLAEVERRDFGSCSAVDTAVRLIKGGAVQGNNKSSGASWPGSDAYTSFGGSSDLWGLTLTRSDVVASNFGFAISATLSGTCTAGQAGVDHIRLTVYYTDGDPSTNWIAGVDRSVSGSPFMISNSSALGSSDYFTLTNAGSAGIASTSPWATLSVEQGSTGPVFVVADQGTSTPSLIVDGNGRIGIGTTTPGSLLSLGNAGVNTINISTTATSTFGSGIDVRTGCFAINGSCVAGGSAGSVTSGTANRVAFYNTTNSVASSDYLYIDDTNDRIGVGTSSPLATLSASSTNSIGAIIDQRGTSDILQLQDGGSIVFVVKDGGSVGMGTTTPGSLLSLGNTGNDTINISATATSTFGSGINIRSGCFAINGSCVTGGGGSGTVNTGNAGYLAFYPSPGGTTVDDTDALYFDDTYNRLGIGTTSPYSALAVVGEVVASHFTATTTATSTFAGGIQTNLLNVTSTTASSTFANGINLANGCFAINGTCVGGSGSGTVGPGTPNKLSYFDSGTTVTSADFLTVDATNNRLGIGTTSPYAALGVSGEVVASHFTATTTATSTLPNLNVSSALALNGDYVTNFDGTGLQLTAGVLSTTLGTSIDLTSEVTGILPVANGGTGQDLSSDTGVLVINSGAVSASSTLAVLRGGTGSTTLTGILKGNGTGAVQTAVAGTDYESPLTFNGPLSRSTNSISITQSGVATDGYLSSTDWNTFNNKVSSSSIDTFTELDLLVADKTLVNADDAATIAGLWAFTNTGTTTFTGGIRTPGLDALNFLAVGTTATTTIVGNNATSTFAGNIDASGDIEADQFFASGSGTSTFAGGIRTNLLNITSTTATSTFANGLNVSNGCYAINGSCVAGGSAGSVTSGTANRVAFYNAANSIASSDYLYIDDTNDRIGIGSSSPWANLSVNHQAGEVAFAIGSSTATSFVVDQNGNVGIGTASPTNPLHIVATNSGETEYFIKLRNNATADNTASGIKFTNSTNDAVDHASINAIRTNSPSAESTVLTFSTTLNGSNRNVERLRIDASGNVGIGTTSPLATLTASSTNSIGAIIDQRGTSDILQLQDSGTSVFVVKDGGKVGIGSTTPSEELSLVGEFWLRQTGNASGITLEGATAGNKVLMYVDAGGALNIDQTQNSSATDYIDIRPGNTSYGVLIRDASGAGDYLNISTNNASPDYANFVVNDTNAVTGFVITSSETVGVGTTSPMAEFAIEKAGSGNIFAVANQGTADPYLIVDVNGRVGIGTTSPAAELGVVGSVLIKQNANTTGSGLRLDNTTGTFNEIYTDATGQFIASSTNGFSFYLDDYEVGEWTTNGFTISDPAGNTMLTIQSTATLADAQLRFDVNGSNEFSLGVDDSDSDNFKISLGSNLGTNDRLTIASGGFGTTTLAGLNISGSATSTSNVGYNITSGCYAVSGTCLSTAGANIWQDSSGVINLVDPTDTVTIGSATPLAKLAIDGYANETQFLIQGFGTQQNDFLVIEEAAGQDIFVVDDVGQVGIHTINGNTASLSPTNTLSVNAGSTNIGGGIDVEYDNLTTSAGTLRFRNDIGLQWNITNYANSFITPALQGDLVFASTTQYNLVLDASGTVGISSTTPWATLSVEQGSAGPVFVVADSGTSTPHLIVDGRGFVGMGTSAPFGLLSVNHTAGTTGFVVGSSTATSFVVDKDGRVGVGTSSPWATLSVEKGSASKTFVVGDEGTSAPYFAVNSDGKVRIGVSAANESAVIHTMIGVSSANTYDNLRVAQLGLLNSNTTDNNLADLAFLTLDTGGTLVGPAKISAIFTDHTAGSVDGELVFQTMSAGSRTEKLRITGSGNVGIGTSSPSTFKLQVLGNVGPDKDDTYDLGSSALRWRDLYLGPASLHIGTDGNEGIIGYDTTNNYIQLDPDGDTTGNFFFTDGGRFGVGSSSPASGLGVAGGGFFDGVVTASQFVATSTTASSTFANGINLTAGCYAVGGTCLSLGSEDLSDNSISDLSDVNAMTEATGDLLFYNSGWTNLTAGNGGEILTMSGGLPTWTSTSTFAMENEAATISGLWAFTNTGTTTFAGGIRTPGLDALNFLAVGTTATTTIVGNNATSTFAGNIDASGDIEADQFFASGSGTSTFAGLTISGGARITSLNCTGFSNGGVLTTDASGNVVCDGDDGGSGSGAVSTGVAGRLSFYPSNGTTVDDTDALYFDDTNDRLGIGTSTPGSILSVEGVGNFTTGTSTLYTGLAAAGYSATSSGISISGGSLNISSGATSTASNGFNITAGCYAIGGTCIGAGSDAGTLDGIDSLSFLRSDTSDTFGSAPSDTLTIASGAILDVDGELEVADTSIAFNGATTNFAVTGDFSINSTEFFLDDATDNVGLGDATPDSDLEVIGGVMVSSAAANDGDRFIVTTGGNVGIGTTSPYTALGVSGEVVAANFTATTSATSTYAGGIQTNLLNVTSATASSTFANGINITAGCYAVGGTCLSLGSDDLTDNSISDLSDVSAMTEATGDLLFYNSGWTNLTAGNGGEILTMSGGLPTWTSTSTFAMENEAATISGLWAFTNTGTTTFAGGIRTPGLDALNFLAVGTTATTTIVGNNATSTFAGNIDASGDIEADQFFASGSGTSTFAGGIRTNLLNITSTTASSTFANGTNLTAGCYAINGSCVAGGSPNYVKTGTANRLAYYDTTGTITSENVFAVDATNDRVGFGTTTPLATLSASSTNAVAAIFDQRGTSDILQLQDGGSTVFVVKDGGNVGIGTSSPFARLSLAPTGNSTIPFAVGSTTGASLAVNNQGYVGIGTAQPSTNLHLLNDYEDPAVRFQVTASAITPSSTASTSASSFANDTTVGTTNWLTPSNASASDNAYVIITNNVTSYYLAATNFGFSLPSSATVVGVVVGIEVDAPNSTCDQDNSVKLIYNGTISGTEHANGTKFPATDGYIYYGSPTDTWGLTLTGADVNASNFGFGFSAQTTSGCSGLLDHMQMKIYYTDGDPSTNWIAGVDRSVSGSPFMISNSSALGSNDYFTLTNAGSAGIASTSPWARLSVEQGSTGPVFVVADQGTSTPHLIVDGIGSIGIGTSSPSSKLSLVGGQYLKQSAETAGSGLRIEGSTAGNLSDLYVAAGGALFIDMRNSSGSSPYIGLLPYDDAYGVVSYSTDAVAYLNTYVTNTTVDYANLVVKNTGSTIGLVITENETVGVGTSSPGGVFSVSGNGDVDFDIGSNEIQFATTTKLVFDAYRGGSGTQFIRGQDFSVFSSEPVYDVLAFSSGYAMNFDLTGSWLGVAAYTFDLYNHANSYFAVTNGAGGYEFYVNNAGVNIGSNSPQEELDVEGQIQFDIDTANDTTIGVCKNLADGNTDVEFQECSTTPGDIAEWYEADEDLPSGTIVTLMNDVITYNHDLTNPFTGEIRGQATSTIAKVTKATTTSRAVIGIVSDSPVQSFGSGVIKSGNHPVPVAMIGRVPLRVSTENGPIMIGDRISPSAVPGVGKKARPGETIVGIALSPFSEVGAASTIAEVASSTGIVAMSVQVSTVEVFTSLGYSTIDDAVPHLASGDQATPWSIDNAGRIVAGADVDFGGKSILSVAGISSATGDWFITADGRFKAKNIVAETIDADRIAAKRFSILNIADASENTIGAGRILRGDTSTTIYSKHITAQSKIFVTFTNDLGGRSWYVAEKKGQAETGTAEGMFRIAISSASPDDLNFDWWVVGVDGSAASSDQEVGSGDTNSGEETGSGDTTSGGGGSSDATSGSEQSAGINNSSTGSDSSPADASNPPPGDTVTPDVPVEDMPPTTDINSSTDTTATDPTTEGATTSTAESALPATTESTTETPSEAPSTDTSTADTPDTTEVAETTTDTTVEQTNQTVTEQEV